MNADAGQTATDEAAPHVRAADAAESPDTAGAYPRLSDEQLAALRRHGHRRAIRPGDVVIAEGDRDRDFTVVLTGRVAVYEGYGTDEQRLVAVHGPGRFLDEIGLLTGQPAFVTSVAVQTGEVLTVPRSALRHLGSRDPHLGDLILRAFVCRREVLLATVAGIRIIGSRYSPDTRRLRELAARNRVPHTWIDLDADPDAEALLRHLDVSPDQTPVVIWRGDRVLHNPDNAEFARLAGIPVQRTEDRLHDLVVVGAGPAGIAAAVYGASEGLATVVLDAIAPGGQAATASRIDNYPGFPLGVSGAELTDRAVVQARRFGAVIGVPAEAVGLHEGDGGHAVRLGDGGEITARAVVVATGTRYRRLDVPRLDEFEGTCVFYAASFVEARLCGRQPVAIVGGGNSAGQAALYLARRAARVRLLVRHGDLGRDMSRYLVDQIERHPDVEVRLHAEVRELVGPAGHLEALAFEDVRTGRVSRVDATLLFVFIGTRPRTDWLQGTVDLDDHGYISTASTGGRQALETSRPGVFAAGDVRSGSIKRVTAAMGEGATAVRLVHEHLARTGRAAGR